MMTYLSGLNSSTLVTGHAAVMVPDRETTQEGSLDSSWADNLDKGMDGLTVTSVKHDNVKSFREKYSKKII